LAGLVPATHVFFKASAASRGDLDARDKPGQGDVFCGNCPKVSGK
jgi:hypothetical protein